MNIQEFTKPATLEKYSFLWSEARLLIGALALFMGGVPPIYLIATPAIFGLVSSLLTLSWIISGAVALYLLSRWVKGGMKLFGKKDLKDMAAFIVMNVTGLNLGITGVTGFNIGFSLISGYTILAVTGVVYLITAAYLYQRWMKHGKKFF